MKKRIPIYMEPEAHHDAKVEATKENKALGDFIAEAIREKIARKKGGK